MLSNAEGNACEPRLMQNLNAKSHSQSRRVN